METKPTFDNNTNTRIQQLMSVILSTRFSDLDKDFDACNELLDISQKNNYTYGLAFAYAYLGDCLIGKNESINASGNLLTAKELCEKNRFLDLLPYICNWLGIYYEMQNDRQMAMRYYLDALEFAEKSNDLSRQSILLNNIASQFLSCGNYTVAKEYYIKAFKCFNNLEHVTSSDPHYAQMTANIISVCCRLNQIEEAKYYFSRLEKSDCRVNNQLYLCELIISTTLGDLKATHESIDKYLVGMQNHPQDIHQLFETLLIISEGMIGLNESAYARKTLMALDGMCKEGEFGHQLKVQYIWMLYYEKFGSEEEKNKAYRKFYQLRKLNDSILNHNLADGLLTQIRLKESMKRNQEMKKKKELLEDEVQIDELTQLFNRRTLRKLTQQVVSDPQIHTLSFIMIDVDYFKQFNDTYGHQSGDQVLQEVADSLADASDSDIYNFRYGGDEFASICKNKSPEEVETYILKFTGILRSKKIPHINSLCSNQVTLSIGYSIQTKTAGETLHMDELIADADKAVYQAKNQGRNCHRLYMSNK